jgi:HPt (histidine-containing phosphotransfer) domain-containing protein
MTAHALKGDRERCLDAGMDEYVAKPIHPRELLQAMEKLVGDADSQPPPPPPPPPSESSPPPERGPVWAETLNGLTNVPRLRKIVAESFIEQTPDLMDSLRQAVADADAAKLKLAAHSLRGSIRYFAAGPAHDLTAQLEAMGDDGRVEGAEAVLPTLEAEMEQLVAKLKASL